MTLLALLALLGLLVVLLLLPVLVLVLVPSVFVQPALQAVSTSLMAAAALRTGVAGSASPR